MAGWRSRSARSDPAYAAESGAVASRTLPQTSVLPLSSAATGPLITRLSARDAPVAVTTTLGAPGCSGVPSESRPVPGTRVESLTWTEHGAPETRSCPASQIPLMSSCPGGGAGPGPAAASPVTAMSPVRVLRELFQTTAEVAVFCWPATMARLDPGGSWTAELPVTFTASEAIPGRTMMPSECGEPDTVAFQAATALSRLG